MRLAVIFGVSFVPTGSLALADAIDRSPGQLEAHDFSDYRWTRWEQVADDRSLPS